MHQLIDNNCNGIYSVVGNERLSKYEFGIKLANCFELNSGLINKSSINDKIKLVDRPKDMSLSNKKICKVLECEFLSIDEQFQALKQQENNNMTNKVIVL